MSVGRLKENKWAQLAAVLTIVATMLAMVAPATRAVLSVFVDTRDTQTIIPRVEKLEGRMGAAERDISGLRQETTDTNETVHRMDGKVDRILERGLR